MSRDPTGAAKAVELAVDNISASVMRFADPTAGEALNDDVRETLLSVICAIVAADSRLDESEKTFLEYLVDASGNIRGVIGVVSEYASRWDRIGSQVPRFFQVAVKNDQLQGDTGTADEIIREIQLVCSNTCVSDGRALQQESTIAKDFIATLERYRDGQRRCLTPRVTSKPVAAEPAVATPSPSVRAANANPPDLEESLAELRGMIGMEEIKAQVSGFTDFLRVEKIRAQRGMARNSISLHAVFVGPPGTGKTTIARLLGKIFAALGFLPKGHVIETDRAGLVGAYLGQTALKVDSVIQQAMGGILFIDEAYALTQRRDDSYGQEAIDTLLKRMEDHRTELAVFVAGYPDEMDRFIEANPGLKSRFNRHFSFAHYDSRELAAIFSRICAAQRFTLSSAAREKLDGILAILCRQRDKTFGNGRLARNLFEKALERQAARLATLNHITDDALTILEASDLDSPTVNVAPPQPHNHAKAIVPKSIESFLRQRSDFQREVGYWFVSATAKYGQTCAKPKSRTTIELKDWTALLSFGDSAVTLETGYGAEDVNEHYAHHVRAMRAISGADDYLQGPGQKHEASSFRVVIAENDAFRVAKLVFDSFANATVQDGECEPITG